MSSVGCRRTIDNEKALWSNDAIESTDTQEGMSQFDSCGPLLEEWVFLSQQVPVPHYTIQ